MTLESKKPEIEDGIPEIEDGIPEIEDGIPVFLTPFSRNFGTLETLIRPIPSGCFAPIHG